MNGAQDAKHAHLDPRGIPTLALAFIGDAVWELRVREHVLRKGVRRPHELHQATTRYVRARSQAHLAAVLGPLLSEEERGFLRRGRNAKPGHTRKSADVLDYRHSTGFETLIGYLYTSGQRDRLDELCHRALAAIDDWEEDAHAREQADKQPEGGADGAP
ncbi:Mini-ribonuclease 3 [Alicyclobacillus macrosporangiidus]|uniref:Mini-ribonuclease 3 n=1 Tax=Alicyclobacillus macrosporangiidus TaxID=392015 RepID=A0A1I7I5X2_9BACL|nr:ribonuclease III domain-containing protein [Alicyclobacillus macrosporangiidus]SFU68324.1 ribonuclease-3 family protein [Alicyclobacillus macrosporangiidus]